MSQRKFYLLLFLLSAFISEIAYSQPAVCITPPNGYTLGGDFTLSPPFLCVNSSSPLQTITVLNPTATLPSNSLVTLKNFGYFFDVYKASNGNYLINNLVDPTKKPPIDTIKYSNLGREYWIWQSAQGGDGKVYYVCKKVPIFSTEMPSIVAEQCGQTVKLTFQKDIKNNYDIFRIIWGDGNPAIENIDVNTYPFEVSHTYTATTPLKIIVQGGHKDPANPSNIVCMGPLYQTDFTPNGGGVYISRLEMTNNGAGATIKFASASPTATIDPTATYKVTAEKNGVAGATQVGTGINGTATISGLDPTATYCFYLESQNSCPNNTPTLPVCSINLQTNVVSTSQVQLNWNHPGGKAVNYEIQSTETGLSTVSKFPTPANKNSFDDNGLSCLDPYNYQIIGTYTVAGYGTVTTISASKSVTTNTSASLASKDPIGIASVEQKNSVINIILRDDVLESKYQFERSVDNSDFKVVAETDRNKPTANSPSPNQYYDHDVDPLNHRYCYRIRYSDACNNTSPPTAPFCSLLLTSDAPATLNWTPFIDDPNYKQYVVYNVSEADSLTGMPIGNPLFYNIPDTQAIVNLLESINSRTYIIQAVYKPPSSPPVIFYSFSNTYTFRISYRVYVPTAFTPNGDGYFDSFAAQGINIGKFEMIVYDRWGNPIFMAGKLGEGWDGNLDDRITPAPAGTYNYVVFITDKYGQKFSRTGSVLLIR